MVCLQKSTLHTSLPSVVSQLIPLCLASAVQWHYISWGCHYSPPKAEETEGALVLLKLKHFWELRDQSLFTPKPPILSEELFFVSNWDLSVVMDWRFLNSHQKWLLPFLSVLHFFFFFLKSYQTLRFLSSTYLHFQTPELIVQYSDLTSLSKYYFRRKEKKYALH